MGRPRTFANGRGPISAGGGMSTIGGKDEKLIPFDLHHFRMASLQRFIILDYTPQCSQDVTLLGTKG